MGGAFQVSERLRRYAATVLFFGTLLLAWEYATTNGYLKPYRFPAPTTIISGFYEISTIGFPADLTIWVHTKTTVLRILQGYVAAVALAIPLGFLIGAFSTLEKLTAPLIIFGRSIATLSLLPLVIVWFGAGELTKVILIGYGCFWTMISNVIAGVKYVDRDLINAARTFGVSGFALFTTVVFPAALPRMFTGARMALGVGFMVIVGAEMIGTIEGLGALIMEARSFYRSEVTIIGMLVIGVIGFLISSGLMRLEKILIPWDTGLDEVRR
jgi:ABC-type nitrate/sulfonate/bicarbonate transport system permease component